MAQIRSDRPIRDNIQALRAAAALLVAFVHIDKLLAGLSLPIFGGGGVDLFFVISGFIMVYTTSARPISSWSFIKDRIARIVPLYWFLTLMVFGLALVAPSILQATRADWGELAKSLAFIPFVKSNGMVQPVLFVGWSLNYEMFFYAIFAIGLALPARRPGLWAVIATIAGLVLLGMIVQPQGVLARSYTDPIMLEFVAGIVIGMNYDPAPIAVGLFLKLGAGLSVLASLVALLILPLLYPAAPQVVVCGLPAIVTVTGALLLERWGWSIHSPVLLTLGNASYSIYLTHPFVTQSMQKLLSRTHGGAVLALASIGLTFVAICVAGYAVHRTLERPLSASCRHLIGVARLRPTRA